MGNLYLLMLNGLETQNGLSNYMGIVVSDNKWLALQMLLLEITGDTTAKFKQFEAVDFGDSGHSNDVEWWIERTEEK